jgi:hypothetical protein
MVMRHSWQSAARHHPGGWLIALATLALVLAPGPIGTPDAAAHSNKNERHDARSHEASGHHRGHGREDGHHGARRDVRHGHRHRDTFAFEGGEVVPRSELKAHFHVRREERVRHHGRWEPRRHHMHGGRVLRVSVENVGDTTWQGPVILVLDRIGGHARLRRPCGYLPTGEPFVCLMRTGAWAPGDRTPGAELRFAGGRHVPFRWHVEAMPPSGENPGNRAPVADAGADQTGFVGDVITLNGSGSTDADGDPLAFSWTVDSAPAGSTSAPSDPTAVNPTFTLDRPGTWVLSLVVDDGLATSAPATVQLTTLNSAPVANAGDDRTAFVGDTVTLDGSKSSDVDGDPLAFSWSIVDAPAGSAAALDDPEAILPSFTVDVAGTYEIELVVSDASDDSAPDTVFVTTLNSAPIADAGPDQAVALGSTVALDGSGSMDVDGDPLTFSWSVTTMPAGSAVALDDPTAETPTFVADVAGTYVAQLVVNDGELDSTPDTVVVSTTNTRPVADAGLDQIVLVGSPATLDGGGSMDPDGNPIAFFWAITSRPAGSTADLDDPGAAAPTFTPDVGGDYLVQLIVSDGDLESVPDTVLVTAQEGAPTLSIGDVTAAEGDAGNTAFVFPVTRTGVQPRHRRGRLHQRRGRAVDPRGPGDRDGHHPGPWRHRRRAGRDLRREPHGDHRQRHPGRRPGHRHDPQRRLIPGKLF